jgi:hypothetical protein
MISQCHCLRQGGVGAGEIDELSRGVNVLVTTPAAVDDNASPVWHSRAQYLQAISTSSMNCLVVICLCMALDNNPHVAGKDMCVGLVL